MVAVRAGEIRRQHPRLRAKVGEQRGLAAGARAGIEDPAAGPRRDVGDHLRALVLHVDDALRGQAGEAPFAQAPRAGHPHGLGHDSLAREPRFGVACRGSARKTTGGVSSRAVARARAVSAPRRASQRSASQRGSEPTVVSQAIGSFCASGSGGAPSRGQAAEDRVDEPGGPRGHLARQLDRFGNGGAIRNAQAQDLARAQPQDREDGGIDAAQRAIDRAAIA